jgi:hypothetical protein
MAVGYKICVDCADPHKLARFWALAMGYVPEDHSILVQQLLDSGAVPAEASTVVDGRLSFANAAAIRDPDDPFDERSGMGQGGRMLFQVVPEGKTAKNRMHLDLHYRERRLEMVAKLAEAGGKVLWEGEQNGHPWTTMADPEGNEFCVA